MMKTVPKKEREKGVRTEESGDRGHEAGQRSARQELGGELTDPLDRSREYTTPSSLSFFPFGVSLFVVLPLLLFCASLCV